MSPERCVACGGALVERFAQVKDPQTGESFRLARCDACGLGHTLPRPRAEELGRYYGPAYHGGRHSLTARLCLTRRLRWLDEGFRRPGGGQEPPALLDVGCGDGSFLLSAGERGWRVAGTELNPALARESGLDVGTGLEEMARHAPFDAVTFWHSLEHLPAPREALERAVSYLRPGGAVHIAVPDADGLQARLFGPRWFHLDVPRHLFHFGARSLQSLVERVGLEVETVGHQEVEYDVMGWAQSALNALPSAAPANLFFQRVTGRALPVSRLTVAAHLVAGAALSAVAVPLTAASSVAGKGGTLVMRARRR